MRPELASASARSPQGGRHGGGAVDDGELLRHVRAGECDAFAALVARHGGPLLRFARFLVHDDVTASGLVQDAWLAMLDAVGEFDERAAFRTWLFRILATRAKGRAMRGGREAPFSAAATPSAHEPGVEPERFDARGMWADPPVRWTQETPRELALQRDTRVVMEGAIEELPLAQKAVLVLRDIEGLDTDEVRGLLDLAEPDQRVLLHRARARVARALEAHERRGRTVGSTGPRGGPEGSIAARSIDGA